jgi:hypothetical protein
VDGPGLGLGWGWAFPSATMWGRGGGFSQPAPTLRALAGPHSIAHHWGSVSYDVLVGRQFMTVWGGVWGWGWGVELLSWPREVTSPMGVPTSRRAGATPPPVVTDWGRVALVARVVIMMWGGWWTAGQ